jgi:hypothetical protein
MRFYHDGKNHEVPTKPHPEIGERAIKVPPMFWTKKIAIQKYDGSVEIQTVPEFRALPEDAVTLSLVGIGFWVIPPGGFIDVPDHVPVHAVKDSCPALLTESEARGAGILPPEAPKPKLK